MEDAWKVTQKTISFCGKLPSLSVFSALPSAWSRNLYLCRQLTLTLKICKSFCPAVFSTLICNTVGRAYSKHSGHPVSFKVCFTDSEHTVCFSSEALYRRVFYKAITFYFVLRNKNMIIKKAFAIVFCHYLQNFQTKNQKIFSPLVLASLSFLNQAYFLIITLTTLKVIAKRYSKQDPNGYHIFQESFKIGKNYLKGMFWGVFFKEYFHKDLLLQNLA